MSPRALFQLWSQYGWQSVRILLGILLIIMIPIAYVELKGNPNNPGTQDLVDVIQLVAELIQASPLTHHNNTITQDITTPSPVNSTNRVKSLEIDELVY